MKNKLHWKDKTIGMISAGSQIMGALLFMFAPNQSAIYACMYLFLFTVIFIFKRRIFSANVLIILSRGAMAVEKPVLNKQIKANEQGLLFDR